MSIVNLGLQSVGVMRKGGSSESEAVITKCNNMKQLRKLAEKQPSLVDDVLDSIARVKILLSDLMIRLELKGKPFGVYHSASTTDIEDVWNSLLQVDSSLKFGEKSLKTHDAFMDHCCQLRHYSFSIKKCGAIDCTVCQPPRLPSATFCKLHFIPDPVPQADGHYKCFEDVYGTTTTEDVRNVNLMVQCEECEMWRLLYSPHKLTSTARQELSALLEDFTYTCGATLSDLELPTISSEVCLSAVIQLRNYIFL